MAQVLLADSQPLFNEALEALFVREGRHHVVGRASGGEEVLQLVRAHRPDLVLVDSGLGLTGRPPLVQRMLDDHPAVRVMVLGDTDDVELLLAAVKAGALGVVDKTCGAATVLRTAQAILDGEGVVPRAMLPELFRRLVASQESTRSSPLSKLSPRERQVLLLLSKGWDNTAIGKELFISPHTVRTHIQNILEKLGLHSKLEAATFAMQRAAELSVH